MIGPFVSPYPFQIVPISFVSNHFETKRRCYRIQQRFVTEGLAQVIHCTVLKSLRTRRLISMCRDEDNRDLRRDLPQLTLKVEPIHPVHAHIKDQTARSAEMIRIQKLFGGSKHLHRESGRPNQALKGLPDSVIIIDN